MTKLIEKLKKTELTIELEEHLQQVPKITDSNHKWDKFTTKSGNFLQDMQAKLGARVRRKVRMNINEAVKTRMFQYKNNQQLGKYLAYAVGKKGRPSMPSVLFEYKNNTVRIIDDPEETK